MPLHTWVPGVLTADDMNNYIRDVLEGMATWTPFTTTWGSSGTTPGLGNGSLLASHAFLGSTVHFYISLTMGSTTTYGTGYWTFTLPYAAVSGPVQLVPAQMQETGVGQHVGIARIASGASAVPIYTTGGLAIGATVPFTFGDTDNLSLAGTYRRA